MFAKFHAEVTLYQSGETKLAEPKEARGNGRVENPARGEVQTAAEQSQIVIRAVQHDFLLLQRSR